jgi:hypothetical protein
MLNGLEDCTKPMESSLSGARVLEWGFLLILSILTK